MKITRETDYAIRSILHMSQEPEKLHMILDIAKSQDVPKSFLAKILQKLAKAEIVSSTRGVNGGFTLHKKPADITLLDVIEAVQGPLFVNACVIDHKSCARRGRCSVHPIWVEIREYLNKKLAEYTFKKILSSNMVGTGARMRNAIFSSKDDKCVFCGAGQKTAPACAKSK